MGRPVPATDIHPADGRALTKDDLDRICVPLRYRDCDESLLPERDRLETWLIDVIAGATTGLYIWGPPGTGKSRALAWLARRVYADAMLSGRTHLCFVRFRTAAELVHDLRRKEWERHASNEALECNVLMLDDLGSAYEHPWITDWFAELIGERYKDSLITCYTANPSIGDLWKRDGWVRSAERLRETCHVVQTAGPNLRRRPQRYVTMDGAELSIGGGDP